MDAVAGIVYSKDAFSIWYTIHKNRRLASRIIPIIERTAPQTKVQVFQLLRRKLAVQLAACNVLVGRAADDA